jgi:hypothetical protein
LGLALALAVAAALGLWWRSSEGDALSQAREAMSRGRMGAALGLVNDALERSPDDARAQELKQTILARIGRLDAETARPPDQELAKIDEARASLSSAEPARAREILEPILEGAHRLEARWLMSRAFLQQGEFERALAALAGRPETASADPTIPEPAPYIGSDACEACHTEIFRSQTQSRHARTIRFGEGLASVRFPQEGIVDPGRPDVTHRFEREDGGGFVVRTSIEGGKEFRALLQFAIGSGDRGVSFIVRDAANQPRQGRISFFHHDTLVDLTPMAPQQTRDDTELQGLLIHDSFADCVGCHSTRLEVHEGGAVVLIDRGISCERCHGPGGHHVAAVAGKFPEMAIAQPRLASAAQIVRLCGQCHQPPRGAALAPNDPTIVRQQSLTMPRSRCYTESEGGLSCITCHNPHRDAETEATHYEAKCLACHGTTLSAKDSRTQGRAAACPVNASSDCVSCHMPKVENPHEHTWFTDHHIRIHRDVRPGAGE